MTVQELINTLSQLDQAAIAQDGSEKEINVVRTTSDGRVLIEHEAGACWTT